MGTPITNADAGFDIIVESIATKLGQPKDQVRADITIEAKRLHKSEIDVAKRVNLGLAQKPAPEKPAETPVEKPAATPAPPAPAKPLNQMPDDEIEAILQTESTAIVETSTPTEATLVSVNQAAAMRVTFDEIKKKVLRQGDIHTIKTKEGNRSYIKKSGWRIIATVFNITDSIISKERIVDGANITWIFEVKASAPNGRSATGIASCSTDERKFSKSSDVMATAHTRAKNRAISDLVGAGEVSAEEIGE
jgi:hypothetical protein